MPLPSASLNALWSLEIRRLPTSRLYSHSLLLVVFALAVTSANLADTSLADKQDPLPSESKAGETALAAEGPLSKRPSRVSDVKALPIVLRQGGFVPGKINLPAGEYFISLTNLSGLADASFQLESEEDGRVARSLQTFTIKKEKRSWRKQVTLSAGVYLLKAADNPDWVCRITVSPK